MTAFYFDGRFPLRIPKAESVTTSDGHFPLLVLYDSHLSDGDFPLRLQFAYYRCNITGYVVADCSYIWWFYILIYIQNSSNI